MATVLQAQIISATLNSTGTSGAATLYTVGANKYSKVTIAILFSSTDGTGATWSVRVNGVAVLTVSAAGFATANGVVTDVDLGAGAAVSLTKDSGGSTSLVTYSITGAEYQNSNYP